MFNKFKEKMYGLMYRLGLLMLKPVYKIYERKLWMEIRKGPFPKHVAIIPDGNRRWARLRNLYPWQGHEEGYKKIREVLDWLWDLGIDVVTIYAMSTENCLYRPIEERKKLFDLTRKAFNEVLSCIEDFNNRGVRIRVIGRLDLVPRDIVELVKEVEKRTMNNNKHVLNIALCYGGRQEILDAVRKVIEEVVCGKLKVNQISEEVFRKYLYTDHTPDPDLIIRTSGEERISNFLLWQSAYSELYFCDIYWPDFRKIDLWRAIRSYQKRERRFGR